MQAMSPQMLAMLAQKSGQMQGGISSLVSKKAPVDSNGLPMVFSETYGWMPDSGDGTVPGMMPSPPQGGIFVPPTGTPGYTDGDRWNNQPPQQTVQPPQQTVQSPSQSPTDYPQFSGGTPNAPGRPAFDPQGGPAQFSGGTPNPPGRPVFDPEGGPARFFREPNAPGRPAADSIAAFNAKNQADAIERAASFGVSRNSSGSNMMSGIQTIGSFFNNLNGAPPEVSTPDPLTPMQGYLGGLPAPTTFSSNIYGNQLQARGINEPQVPVSVDQPQSPMQMFQDRQPPSNQIFGGQNPTSSPYGNQLPSPYSGQYGFNRPPAPTLPAFDNMAGQNFQPRPQYSGPPNYLDMLNRGQTGLRAFGSYK